MEPAVSAIVEYSSDPSGRVVGRFSQEALYQLQHAMSAAQTDTLTSQEASEVIKLLNTYIAVTDNAAMKAGAEPSELVRQQHTDAADGAPTFEDVAVAAQLGTLTRHQVAAAIRALAAEPARRLAAVRHSDAAEPTTTTYTDLAARMFDARETWIKTGQSQDKATFDAALSELNASVISLDPGCDHRAGIACPCTFLPTNPLKRKTDMSDPLKPWEKNLVATAPSTTHLDSTDPKPWLRPLSELVPSALSKDAPGQLVQRRAKLDAQAAADAHERELAGLHAPIRERDRKALFDAAPGPMDVCSSCDQEPCVCRRPAAPGKPPAASKGKRAMASPAASSVPPWRKPLTLSSERAQRIPSAAMRFEDDGGDDGGGRAA